MMPGSSIHWPAIIKYDGDAELTYVSDRDEWLGDADLSGFDYDPNDCLIDSNGQVFSLCRQVDDLVEPCPVNEILSSEQLVAMLREHFSVTAACCVSKLNPGSISDCMDILKIDHES